MTNKDALQEPFDRHLGLAKAGEPGFFYALEADGLTNHPVAALFALAEATSEAILLREFGPRSPHLSAVVRHVDAKFGELLNGRVQSRGRLYPDAWADAEAALEKCGRALVAIAVEIVDESQAVGLRATIEWYVRQTTSSSEAVPAEAATR